MNFESEPRFAEIWYQPTKLNTAWSRQPGSLQSEAEQVMETRKNAFNKALRDYKKETGFKPAQTKRTQKNSKQVDTQQSQNGY